VFLCKVIRVSPFGNTNTLGGLCSLVYADGQHEVELAHQAVRERGELTVRALGEYCCTRTLENNVLEDRLRRWKKKADSVVHWMKVGMRWLI